MILSGGTGELEARSMSDFDMLKGMKSVMFHLGIHRFCLLSRSWCCDGLFGARPSGVEQPGSVAVDLCTYSVNRDVD